MEINKAIQEIKNACPPDRISDGPDDNVLLEYWTNGKWRGGCDIYPNGDINVIIEEGGIDHVYEFEAEEWKEVIKLLKEKNIMKTTEEHAMALSNIIINTMATVSQLEEPTDNETLKKITEESIRLFRAVADESEKYILENL